MHNRYLLKFLASSVGETSMNYLKRNKSFEFTEVCGALGCENN